MRDRHRTLLFHPESAFDLKDQELLAFKEKLDGILSRGTPVYIDANGLYSYDFDKKFSTMIKKNYRVTYLGKHLMEDWHEGEIVSGVQWQALFKVESK